MTMDTVPVPRSVEAEKSSAPATDVKAAQQSRRSDTVMATIDDEDERLLLQMGYRQVRAL